MASLHTLLDSGNLTQAKQLLQAYLRRDPSAAHVNPNERNANGHTLLHVCAIYNYDGLIPVLVNAGADVNALDTDGCDALLLACKNGNAQAVKRLLKCNVDLERRSSEGFNGVHYAALGGFNYVLETILPFNPKLVNTRTSDGACALHFAAHNGHTNTIGILQNFNATMNFQTVMGNTPLHVAAMKNNSECGELLVHLGADTKLQNGKGLTAYDIAEQNGFTEFMRMMKDDSNSQDAENKGRTHGLGQQATEQGDGANAGRGQGFLSYFTSNADRNWDGFDSVRVASYGFFSYLVFLFPYYFRMKLLRSMHYTVVGKSTFSEIYSKNKKPSKVTVERRRTINDEAALQAEQEARFTRVLIPSECVKYFDEAKKTRNDTNLTEYLIYLVMFLVLLIWFIPVTQTYEQNDLIANYFSAGDDSQTDYSSVVVKDNIYDFLQTVIIPQLYSSESASLDPNDKSVFICGGDRMIGLALLRQKRLLPDDCRFDLGNQDCYGYYKSSNVDKRPFGPNLEYKYSHGYPPLRGSPQYNQDPHITIHRDYGHSAHAVLIPYGEEASNNFIEELKNNSWIDLSTRIVALNMGFLDLNLGQVTSAEYIFEISPTGRIQPTRHLTTYPLSTIDTHFGISRFAYFIVFSAFGFFYYFTLFRNIFIQKLPVLSDKWNVFEIVTFGFFVGVLYCISYFVSESNDLYYIIERLDFNEEPYKYVDVETAAQAFSALQNVAGAACMFSFVKFLKFFRLNNNLSVLGRLLGLAFKDLLAFVLVFIVIFISYSFQGYFYFGSQNADYHDFSSSFTSTVRLLSGDFDYEALNTSNAVLAPIFLLTFIVIITLILVNVFIAILSEYYTEGKTAALEDKNRRIEYVGESELFSMDSLRGYRPHIRLPKSADYSVIRQGDIVVLIPSDVPSVEEKELCKALRNYDQSMKLLVMKSYGVDHRYVFKTLPENDNLTFYNAYSNEELILATMGTRVVQDTLRIDDDNVLNIKGLIDEQMIMFYECLQDIKVDNIMYLELSSIDTDRYMKYGFRTMWMSRMLIPAKYDYYMSETEIERVIRQWNDFFSFDAPTEEEQKKLWSPQEISEKIEQLKNESPELWTSLQPIESILPEKSDEDVKFSVVLGAEELTHDIRYDMTLLDGFWMINEYGQLAQISHQSGTKVDYVQGDGSVDSNQKINKDDGTISNIIAQSITQEIHSKVETRIKSEMDDESQKRIASALCESITQQMSQLIPIDIAQCISVHSARQIAQQIALSLVKRAENAAAAAESGAGAPTGFGALANANDGQPQTQNAMRSQLMQMAIRTMVMQVSTAVGREIHANILQVIPAIIAGSDVQQVAEKIAHPASVQTSRMIIQHMLLLISRKNAFVKKDRLDTGLRHIVNQFPSSCSMMLPRKKLYAAYKPKPMLMPKVHSSDLATIRAVQDIVGAFLSRELELDHFITITTKDLTRPPAAMSQDKLWFVMKKFNKKDLNERALDRKLARKFLGMIVQFGFNIRKPDTLDSTLFSDLPNQPKKSFAVRCCEQLPHVFDKPIPDFQQFPVDIESSIQGVFEKFSAKGLERMLTLINFLARGIHDEVCLALIEKGYSYQNSSDRKLMFIVPFQFVSIATRNYYLMLAWSVLKFMGWIGCHVEERKRESRWARVTKCFQS